MTEKEKQLSGEYYNPDDAELKNLRNKSREFMRLYNNEPDENKRYNILKEWLGDAGENCYIEPPFFCDYGSNLSLGKNVYINTNCTILDSAKVTISEGTMIGSNVQICTPSHPINPYERVTVIEQAKPASIGKYCWIGSSVTIIGGVTIGDGTTIGAGSVVTKDIPSNVVAVGNPCKATKTIDTDFPNKLTTG